MEQSPEPRKQTAEETRMRLQIETLLLVWVRTSLALMGFGFVVARFGLFLREVARVGDMRIKPHPRLAGMTAFTGTALIVLGVVMLLLAVATHQNWIGRLQRGELSLTSRWSLGVVLCLILAAMGMGLAVYLASVD